MHVPVPAMQRHEVSPVADTDGPLALLRRHLGLVVLLAVGLALRITALVAVYPGIWFPDSHVYVRTAATGVLSPVRVTAYSLFVAPFWHLGSAGALIIAQHILGLGLVVFVYALLLRRGVPRALAVLGATPLALDAYLVDIEHAIMSEVVFHAALLGAVGLVLWKERLGLVAAGGAGVLLGYAGVTRSVGAPFVVVLVAYLLLRRVGWRQVAAFCAGAGLVLGGYATLFLAQHGSLGFTEYSGRFLYSKTAPFADCARMEGLPADERRFCPDPENRLTPNSYLWSSESPVHGVPTSEDARIGDFAKRVIADRPGTYARLVLSDFLHYFEPGHRIGEDDYSDTPWQFPLDPREPEPYPGYRGAIQPGEGVLLPAGAGRYLTHFAEDPRYHVPASRLLHHYQRIFYTGGQLLAVFLTIVLAALALRRGPWRLRLDAALLAVLALTALAVVSLFSVFSYRYILTAVVLLPPAAALAGTALLGRGGRSPAGSVAARPPGGPGGSPRSARAASRASRRCTPAPG